MAKKTFDFGIGPTTIDLDREYTPDPKSIWLPKEVMVFGSNVQGEHFGGAARFAHDVLGAPWGLGEGLHIEEDSMITYAFPTLNFATTAKNKTPNQFIGRSHKVSYEQFEESMHKLQACIIANPELKFYITKLGLGIAGWDLWDVHRAFWSTEIIRLPNVVYPMEFEAPDDMGA